MSEGDKSGAPEPVVQPEEVIKPLPVTLIGVREPGTGAPIKDGQIIVTPDHQPNLVARVFSPFLALGIRTLYVYATALLGFLTTAMIPPGDNPVLKAMHAMEFTQLLYTAAGVAIAPAGYELVKSVVTILGRLERSHPLATGSI